MCVWGGGGERENTTDRQIEREQRASERERRGKWVEDRGSTKDKVSEGGRKIERERERERGRERAHKYQQYRSLLI